MGQIDRFAEACSQSSASARGSKHQVQLSRGAEVCSTRHACLVPSGAMHRRCWGACAVHSPPGQVGSPMQDSVARCVCNACKRTGLLVTWWYKYQRAGAPPGQPHVERYARPTCRRPLALGARPCEQQRVSQRLHTLGSGARSPAPWQRRHDGGGRRQWRRQAGQDHGPQAWQGPAARCEAEAWRAGR